jgi:hypothetical protein
MFIPVPIKAKYFVPGLVLVDLYWVSGQSILVEAVSHISHVGGALFLSNYVVLEEESV